GVLLADKWLGLPPGTPKAIVEIYRRAYRDMAADPEFLAQGRRISEVFTPMTASDIRLLIETVAEAPPAAIEFLDALLRKQALNLYRASPHPPPPSLRTLLPAPPA